MVRPPKEQVDEIVDAHRQEGFVTAADADVLVAEVLALREELENERVHRWDANRELSAMEAAPRYSTEAVDALTRMLQELSGELPEHVVSLLDWAVASREPKL